ncbi:MAG: hypothetical protein IKE91_03315 [Clostridia bacterium]|nr:hypothetical protein [Clostridia bacterium]
MNKDINYKIVNPGGNITALVNGLEFSAKEREEINNRILEINKEVEQVGFIDYKQNRLEMAGGEFCMNATRCTIWELLKGKTGELSITVSGYKSSINGGIKNNRVYANLKIEQDLSDLVNEEKEYSIVNLDGITLVVIDEDKSKESIKRLKEDENKAKDELKEFMKNIKTDEKAVGVILLEKENNKLKINPVIWVKEIDTLYYESACGSGSLAAAIYKYTKSKTEDISIMQPSGYSIDIELDAKDEYIFGACVTGEIVSVEEKILY